LANRSRIKNETSAARTPPRRGRRAAARCCGAWGIGPNRTWRVRNAASVSAGLAWSGGLACAGALVLVRVPAGCWGCRPYRYRLRAAGLCCSLCVQVCGYTEESYAS
jgi:hypothetical protein